MENVLLNENGVLVSTARLQVGATMYPLRGITASTVVVVPGETYGGRKVLGVLLLLFALAVFPAAVKEGFGPVMFPLVMGLLGVLMLKASSPGKPVYHLRIATAGGQQNCLSSLDLAWIQRVNGALVQALTSPG